MKRWIAKKFYHRTCIHARVHFPGKTVRDFYAMPDNGYIQLRWPSRLRDEDNAPRNPYEGGLYFIDDELIYDDGDGIRTLDLVFDESTPIAPWKNLARSARTAQSLDYGISSQVARDITAHGKKKENAMMLMIVLLVVIIGGLVGVAYYLGDKLATVEAQNAELLQHLKTILGF